LARLLRAHIKRFGTSPGGRVFQTAPGNILQDSGCNEVWDQAHKEALTPARDAEPDTGDEIDNDTEQAS